MQTAVPKLPAQLPQYEYLGYLGGGGMGEIYKARHIHLDRQVVIKWLRTDLSVSAQLESRFAREMLAVGQLNHPNIVAATDAGIAESRRFLVMEFIDGLDLAELCSRVGHLSIADAAEVMRQSAAGLAHAHDNGIVHRDIKPTNLMLASDGIVKLLDLGLALLQGDESATHGPLTRTDSGPFGTYDYMSPEQWNNSHDVDSRGDLYSLGCTFYFLLVGHAPYETPQHKSVTAKMRGHVIDPVPSIRSERSDVPRKLAALLERMLAKEPADRFQTAGELAAALAPFTEGCDLRGLIYAAHTAPAVANTSSKTDPESATVLSNSPSARVASPPSAGQETAAISRAGTSVFATPARRQKPRWIATAIGIVAVVAAGVILALTNRDHATSAPGGNLNTGTGEEPPVPVVLPRFKEIAEQSIKEEQEFSLLVAVEDQATLAGRFSFELADGAPDGMRIDPQTGVLRWTPTEEQGKLGATYPVTIVAKPSQPSVARSEVTFLVRVDEVNRSPQLSLAGATLKSSAPPALSAEEEQPIEIVLTANDADSPPNRLALTSAMLPANARLVPTEGSESSWTLQWTPGEEHGGAGLVRVPLTLSDGVVAEQFELAFNVAEVNEPPSLDMIDGRRATGDPIVIKAKEGEVVRVELAGTDRDLPRNALTIEPVDDLPEGAEFLPVATNPGHWILQWTPGEAVGGGPLVPITVRLGDGAAFSQTQRLLLEVAEVNQPPVVTLVDGRAAKAVLPFSASEGKPLVIPIVVDDPDLPANPIVLEATAALPQDAQLARSSTDPRTWLFSWTPGEDFGGEDPIRIPLRARDAAEATSDLVSLVVNVAETNEPPTFEMVGGARLAQDRVHVVEAAEGSPLEVLLVAADPDRPANPLKIVSAMPLPDGAAIVPVAKVPSTWKLTWTPGEKFGSDRPLDIVLRIDDEQDQSEAAVVRINVKEMNTAPELAEIERQQLGPGESLALEIPVADADLPEQELKPELIAAGIDASAELVTRNDQRVIRVTWTPSQTEHLGKPVNFTLRVRDSGEPPLTVERRFEVEAKPYVENTLGMQFAMIPAGVFQMGNLNPQLLSRLTLQPKGKGDSKEDDKSPNDDSSDRAPAPSEFDRPFPTDPVDPAFRPLFNRQPQAGPDGKPVKRPDPPPPDDLPIRQISIADDFYLGAFEVTQAQYEAVMRANPSRFANNGLGAVQVLGFATANLPVESVTYEQAVEFCRLLSALPAERSAGRSYRLPTEMEWEYAARAGTKTLFYTGNTLTSEQANFDGRFPTLGGKHGPFLERTTFGGGMAPPNQDYNYEPNGFGLHDMLGNVSEWCLDWYARDTYSQSHGPLGPPTGTERVVRGGNYRSLDYLCRCSFRSSMSPNDANPRTGFRVVMIAAPPVPQLPPRPE